jgi:hypothetical protein
MSEIKVNKISPKQTCTQVTLGDSGDTFTIPAGVTLTNNGTATGFGPTGAVSWNTTKITADPNPAVSGVGYFADTTSSAFTVTLPAAPSAGDIVALSDYTGTWGTNNITVGRNSSNINGAAADLVLNADNTTATLIYVDGTEGWRVIDTGSLSEVNVTPGFVAAIGGTVTCCGDYKIHTFTGPGTFTVLNAGNPVGSNSVDYLVVAGGGGASAGPTNYAAGGGAGGFRESSGAASGCYTASPLGACVSALPVSVQGYPIVIGAGGAGVNCEATPGNNGIPSSALSITATGGGFGAPGNPAPTGGPGGSGGGGATTAGTGNTPPVSPPQGQSGGTQAGGSPNYGRGGGGGAGGVGSNGTTTTGGNGGIGVGTQINPAAGTPGPSGPLKYFAGGGGAGIFNAPGTAGTGGAGGGGNGAPSPGTPATSGTANTGGGAGGQSAGTAPVFAPTGTGRSGGSGIVIIRYKYQ